MKADPSDAWGRLAAGGSAVLVVAIYFLTSIGDTTDHALFLIGWLFLSAAAVTK